VMRWRKLGLVFAPNNHYQWMRSHAANPFAEHIRENVFRVYFSCRDDESRSSIGYVVIEITDKCRILDVSDNPVLTPGSVGLFDDSGVSMGCMITFEGKKYLYYIGWNLSVTVPWRNTIGVAISNGRSTHFEKYSKVPIIDRSEVDPYCLSYPFVLADNGIFRMWYGSNLSWGKQEKDMRHVIKYATSTDGMEWITPGTVVLNLKDSSEYAISRPHVVKDTNVYKMWYSYRGEAYRIGYAESPDGVEWTRKDNKAGIDVSARGWDSEMIAYPFVFDHAGQRYMLYNGNGYGRTGFGMAVLDSE
jgi:hypothetical protein